MTTTRTIATSNSGDRDTARAPWAWLSGERHRTRRTLAAVRALVAAALLSTGALPASDWPAWRGTSGDGVTTESLPELIDPEHPRWVIDIPGESTSTPIVVGDRIFLTSQLGTAPIQPWRGQGEDGPAPDPQVEFVVLAFGISGDDAGTELWRKTFQSSVDLQPVHLHHNLASPSPVSDGERVIFWFGTGLVVSFTLDGELEWRRHLGEEISPFDIRWAHGSSPVLHDGLVYFICDHAPKSYLLALDAASGKEVWRADRGQQKRTYSTPLVIPRSDGDGDGGQGHIVVVNSNQRIDGYDAASGDLVWWADQPNRVPVPTPVWHDGVLYSSRGYRSGPYLALRTGGTGDVTATHTLWRKETGAPYVSSPLYHRGLVYLATEVGVASAIDADTGESVWRQRLGGNFSASPLAAGDEIVFVNQEGDLFVIAAGSEYRLVRQVTFPERVMASPVLTGGRLYVRTDSRLYAF